MARLSGVGQTEGTWRKIRDYIGVRAYDAKAAAWLTTVAEKAAELRSVLPDIINTMLEELAHHRYSRFTTCGAYEGHYILDLCQENASDVRPTYLHRDTHAQNYVAFGLAPFPGAKLMPRTRRFKEFNLYRPSQKKGYKHIDALFNRSINWDLIERHYRDVLRYAISMKLGRISPSTILRRFNNKSQKNRIHDAMHEMGAAYRTSYLLEYIEDHRMREAVSAAANKSEAYNHFTKWTFFANGSLIDETIRHEQQKLIRYNHAVANMIMFHNVQQMQRILMELRGEGWEITPEMIEALGPYRTQHINRLGQHTIDTNRSIEALRRDSQIPLSRLLGHKRPREESACLDVKGLVKTRCYGLNERFRTNVGHPH